MFIDRSSATDTILLPSGLYFTPQTWNKRRKLFLIRSQKTDIKIHYKSVWEKKLVTSRNCFFMLCSKWIVIKYTITLRKLPLLLLSWKNLQTKGIIYCTWGSHLSRVRHQSQSEIFSILPVVYRLELSLLH